MEDLTTEQLCSAAGLADKTYRRARQALLASGELVLLSGVGGRGNTNQWEIPDPRLLAGEPRTPTAGRRVPPPPGARPLIASVTAHVSTTSQESPDQKGLRAHTVELHRVRGGLRLHQRLKGSHVRDIGYQSDPVRTLWVTKRANGDTERPEDLGSLR